MNYVMALPIGMRCLSVTRAPHLLLDNDNGIGIYIVIATVHFISLSDPSYGSLFKNKHDNKRWS
jgi:hypothetical protein